MAFGPMPDEEPLDLQEVARIIFCNWRDELTAFLRASFIDRQRDRTDLRLHPSGVSVHRITKNHDEKLGDVTRAGGSDAACAAELAALVSSTGLGRDICLTLSADAVLRPKLVLPKASRTAFQGALRYEVERISPVDPAELIYDHIARPSGNDTLSVDLRIVRRTLVDDALVLCTAAGLRVAGIAFEGDPRPADWRRFPLDRKAFLRTLWERFGTAVLGGLAVLLLIAVLLTVYLRGAATLDVLSNEVADAGVRAARVEQLKSTIARTRTDLGFAARQKQSAMFIGVLDELTRILPDGTWVNELTLNERQVRIEGLSTDASSLIGLIDNAPHFANAKFEAPLVHDATANTDRFDLSFEIGGNK